jgi:hypothetical protein
MTFSARAESCDPAPSPLPKRLAYLTTYAQSCAPLEKPAQGSSLSHRRWEPLQYKGWIPDPLSAPPSPVEYATARLLARAAGLVHRLFILRLFRGECSVSALPGWVLVRRREVLPDRLLLLAVSLFVFFDSGPPTRESADTTVPTAVPTFCATSVKTPPSTDVNLPFEASIPSEQVS